jgi:hypothetical protein
MPGREEHRKAVCVNSARFCSIPGLASGLRWLGKKSQTTVICPLLLFSVQLNGASSLLKQAGLPKQF